jgi:pimeloyl-ACP methyl ester carboxylesterase
VSVVLLVGSGTSVAGAQEPGAVPATVAPPVPALTWAPCDTAEPDVAAGVQCASAAVPLDYDEPAGPQVQIALAKVPATDPAQRIGSLFFNPGGPGGPAVEFLQTAGASRFAALNQRFDIVAFDPRGVGQSSPSIDCVIPESEDPATQPSPTPIDLDADALVALAQRYVDSCLASNDEILAHVSTANVARDLDLLRAAVGDERLSYLGYSYGTFLGATYAALFPDRHRALVLDGAIDPVAYIADPVSLSTEQLAGFELALDRFLLACAADQAACSGFGGSDPAAAYDALLAAAATAPLPADRYTPDTRPVTVDDVRAVTSKLLYSKPAWGLLAEALAQGAAGDGSLLRAIVDLIVQPRDEDGSLTPLIDRLFAISAAERQWPTDVDEYLERGAREWAEFPHFWGVAAYSEIPFALWPVRDDDAYAGPFTVDPASATPLVIGTTYDPATPYSGSVAMVERMGNARLLTMEGDGHTAYGGNSSCIDSATEAYLIDLVLPAPGTVCQQEVPFEAVVPVEVGAGSSGSPAAGLLAVPAR